MLCNSCKWYEYGNVGAGKCGNEDSDWHEQDVDGGTACGLGE